MKSILRFFKQAYPTSDNLWRITILISLFIGPFLWLFQPFGLAYYSHPYKTVHLLGYSLVTFIILVIDLFGIRLIFRKWFKESEWTVLKEIIWLMWILISIGFANAYYSSYIFELYTSPLKSIFYFLFFTFITGLIPVTILVIIQQNYLLKKHISSANFLNDKILTQGESTQESPLLSFTSENEKDNVQIPADDFLYSESSGNYIEIFYRHDDEICKKMLRNTLKNTLIRTKEADSIVQCHRAFLVNIDHITNVSGNSQGLRLQLKEIDKVIPVSRGFVNSMKEKISL